MSLESYEWDWRASPNWMYGWKTLPVHFAVAKQIIHNRRVTRLKFLGVPILVRSMAYVTKE